MMPLSSWGSPNALLHGFHSLPFITHPCRLFFILLVLQSEGYDPRRSKVSDDRMEQWRTAPVTGDLQEIPGIGPAAVKKLAESDEDGDKITNTYQLFGKFLMLKGPDDDDHKVEPMEHTQKFWEFLKNRGVSAHRSAIVKAIAEKASTFFNNIYDANDFDDDEEEQ